MSNEQQPDDDNDPNFDTNSVDNTQPTEKVTTRSEDIDNTPVKQIVESTFEPSIDGFLVANVASFAGLTTYLRR